MKAARQTQAERLYTLLGDLPPSLLADAFPETEGIVFTSSKQTHIRRIGRAILAYAACIALLVGAIIYVPKLVQWIGKNSAVSTTVAPWDPEKLEPAEEYSVLTCITSYADQSVVSSDAESIDIVFFLDYVYCRIHESIHDYPSYGWQALEVCLDGVWYQVPQVGDSPAPSGDVNRLDYNTPAVRTFYLCYGDLPDGEYRAVMSFLTSEDGREGGVVYTPFTVGDPNSKPDVTTEVTTTDPAPSTSEPEPFWSASYYDPWVDREQAEPLALGKLYYTLDPKMEDNTVLDASSRYLMSFTYITADYFRYHMDDYLDYRGFERISYKDGYDFVCITEEELQTITPESVQEFYQLSAPPAVVGIHRYRTPITNVVANYNSENHWYRADLIWGEFHTDDANHYDDGSIHLYESIDPKYSSIWDLDPKKLHAIYVEVYGEGVSNTDESSAAQFFADRGWEVLSLEECSNFTNFSHKEALIAVTLEQLWTVTIEDFAQYYECDSEQIGVTFFQAVPPYQMPNL